MYKNDPLPGVCCKYARGFHGHIIVQWWGNGNYILAGLKLKYQRYYLPRNAFEHEFVSFYQRNFLNFLEDKLVPNNYLFYWL